MIKYASDILDYARQATIPFSSTIELTYRCNMSCLHCYIDEKINNELSTQEVFDILKQLADAGTLEITFTGGEALLRSDFFDIAEYARSLNFSTSLISNGTVIDENISKKLKEVGLTYVSVSIYAATPISYKAITGSDTAYNNAFNSILFLKSSGLRVDVKTPVMKLNYKEIDTIYKWCIKNEVELNADPSISVSMNGGSNPLKQRLDTNELLEYLIWENEAGYSVLGKQKPLTDEHLPKRNNICNGGVSFLAISPTGKVFPCTALRLEAGDLRTESLSNIWKHSKVLNYLRNIKADSFCECQQCNLLNECSPCPGDAYFEDGSFFGMHRESCRIIKMRKEVAQQ